MILKSDSITVVRDAIRRWVNLLSEGNFEEAAQEISAQGSTYSAELLINAIGRYSRKYRDAPENERSCLVPSITSPDEMIIQGENMVVYVDNTSAVIEYDLPIERSWSDLTVKFRLTDLNEEGPELSLIDIRVL